MHDLRELVRVIEETVTGHRIGPGRYARHLGDADPSPYGVADAANLLYTVGKFPRDAEERRAFVDLLRSMQNREDGLYHDETHHPIHTTAQCVSALELFDATPARKPLVLLDHATPVGIRSFLDGLDWSDRPWTESHKGAGLYTTLTLTYAVDDAWREAYFDWLFHETDRGSGLLRRGAVPSSNPGALFPHLAGTFHYLFTIEYAREPIRYPESLIDTCLDLWESVATPLGRSVGFAEIDWVYCMTRARRQCGHRFSDVSEALQAFTDRYVPMLVSLDHQSDPSWNDLHRLFGAVSALAELQAALPGYLRTERPLRLVLDRRPFI